MTGRIGYVEAVVTNADTAVELGSGDVAVLGTPRLVSLLEAAAVAAVGQTLERGTTTVGVRVDIRHTAPTPVGAVVRAEARIVQTSGKRIAFDVVATCRDQEIARGHHTRVVVDRDAFLETVARSD